MEQRRRNGKGGTGERKVSEGAAYAQIQQKTPPSMPPSGGGSGGGGNSARAVC